MNGMLYQERIQSRWTTLLFILLAAIFLGLASWRYSAVGIRFIPGLFLFLGLVFIFYVFNYRVLEISISDQLLKLRFGLVRWQINMENIREAELDDSPALIRYGGAGVHFAFARGEYRAFYNFLEFSRINLRFKKKVGPVQGLVITTRQPEQLLKIIRGSLEVGS